MFGFRAVPRRSTPAAMTVDSGPSDTRGRRTPRFVNLVVRAYREWDEGRPEDPTPYLVTPTP